MVEPSLFLSHSAFSDANSNMAVVADMHEAAQGTEVNPYVKL